MPLVTLLMVGIILQNAIRRSNRNQKRTMEEFWAREREADRTPAVPISDLPYITLPEDLPLTHISDSPRILEYQETLSGLSEKRILNLTGLSNTDIKLRYGARNLHVLSMADQNFTILCRTLIRFAKACLEEGLEEEALRVLRFGTEIGSDARENWTLLGEHYLASDDIPSLKNLRKKAELLPDTLTGVSIRKALDGLLLTADAASLPDSEDLPRA